MNGSVYTHSADLPQDEVKLIKVTARAYRVAMEKEDGAQSENYMALKHLCNLWPNGEDWVKA